MSISETWQVVFFPRLENGYGSLNLGNLLPVLSRHVVLVVGGVSRATSLLHGSAGPGQGTLTRVIINTAPSHRCPAPTLHHGKFRQDWLA